MKLKKRKIIFGAMGFVLFALVAAIWFKGVFSGQVLDIYNPVTGEKRAMLHDDPYFMVMGSSIRRVKFYVSDPAISDKWIYFDDAINLGEYSLHQEPVRVFWSQDGSVIASQNSVLSKKGHSLISHGILWTHFYDFKQHKDNNWWSLNSNSQRLCCMNGHGRVSLVWFDL